MTWKLAVKPLTIGGRVAEKFSRVRCVSHGRRRFAVLPRGEAKTSVPPARPLNGAGLEALGMRQLDYAEAPAWHRRRGLRWAILVIVVLAISIVGWRWVPAKWERAQLLFWQWRCLRYSAPADEIVFDQDPAGKSAVLSGRGYVAVVKPGYEGPAITVAAAEIPNCASQFMALLPTGVGTPRGKYAPPILFMHERSSPSGKKYLVVLSGIIGEDASSVPVGQLWVNDEVWSEGSFSDLPQQQTGFQPYGGIRFLAGSIAKRIRIFAGQADAKDSTHFTIRFEVDGRAGIVDGYVGDPRLSSLGGMGLVRLGVRPE